MVVAPRTHPEPDAEPAFPHQAPDRRSFFLVIVIGAIGGIFLVAVVASIICHRVAGGDHHHHTKQAKDEQTLAMEERRRIRTAMQMQVAGLSLAGYPFNFSRQSSMVSFPSSNLSPTSVSTTGSSPNISERQHTQAETRFS